MEYSLDDKFDQILKHDSGQERFEDENQAIPYLRMITGFRYTLEVSLHRKSAAQTGQIEEGRFYQVVPDKVDNGFFDWYCDHRPDEQYFRTVEMALLQFVFYWHVWMKEGGQKSPGHI